MVTGQEGPFVPSLETHAVGTPLQEFEAVLQGYRPENRHDDNNNRDYKVILFDFVDLHVIRAREVYAFPIAVINIGYSTSTQTRWDALAQSIKKLYGHIPALDEIVGKKQHWVLGDYKLRAPDPETGKWGDVIGEAWQIASIDGVSAADVGQAALDVTDRILAMLDGKLEADFYQAFYQDPEVRKHPDLITAASDRVLLQNLEKGGRASRDDTGVWHRTDSITGTTA